MTAQMTGLPSAGMATGFPAVARERIRTLVTSRFERSIRAPKIFFDANADAVSATTLAMARRFRSGGRLLVFGEGANATDAQHVSVEFVHPVIVGKRALPAIALTNDVASLTAPARGGRPGHGFDAMLRTLGRSTDIALGLCDDRKSSPVTEALDFARDMRMLTIAVASHPDNGSSLARFDHLFSIRGEDPLASQEVSETLYHVLWELVHIFLDHMPDDSSEMEG